MKIENNSRHICAEIMYDDPAVGQVHSDICIETSDLSFDLDDSKSDEETLREFYHKALDEWFDSGNGTGLFYIGDLERAIS